ncbi:hypothetical protein PENTCL1PPCAC_28809 [Pristionchus entomophagus]|uniref:Acyltransferase n=1 Tax=Pristionchus entomophagus TaxID=358040 RepID=A0AAV5UHW3_9BILA|nr:hypothetical protein PENTCL1PPCAC_28809 [Pristionchus entomophagus]
MKGLGGLNGERRVDIQGLRGFCLVSVVFFHIWPQKFVNGYIGVDIFFLISGYLITHILSSKQCINLEGIADFYKRRFKRIIPMYALTVLATVAIAAWLFTDRLINTMRHKLPWVAAFAMNIGNLLDTKDYWTAVNEIHLFTHLWSLGLEIQFYLLVPFLLLAERLIALKTATPPFLLPLALSLVTLILFLITGPIFSFNTILTRLWQFLTAKVVSDVWKYAKASINEKSDECDDELKKIGVQDFITYGVCLALSSFVVLLGFTPDYTIDPVVLRLSALAAMSFVLIAGQKPFTRAKIFELPILTFLGDISYVAYLVHWPIIAFTKFFFDVTIFGVFEGSFVLILSLLVASALHFHLERPSLFWPFPVSTTVVIVAYALCALSFTPLLYRVRHHLFIKESVWSSESYLWNNHLDQHWKSEHKNRTLFEGCVNDTEGKHIIGKTFLQMEKNSQCIVFGNPSSNLDILLVGNSFAGFSAPHFHGLAAGRFRTLRGIIQKGCSFFQPRSIRCQQYRDAVFKLADATRPAIIIVSIRTYAPQMDPIVDNDQAIAEMKEIFDKLSTYARFVIVDDAYPAARVPSTVPTSLLKRARFNQSITDLKQDFKSYSSRFRHYFDRVKQFNHSNIIRLETGKLMFNGSDTFTWFNPHNGHSRYCDDYHLSNETFEIMKPNWKIQMDSVFESLKLSGIR